MKINSKIALAIVVPALSASLFAAPASAAVVFVPASVDQGTLVHGTGTETTAYDVVANLGSNGPNIVHFTGDTTQTTDPSDLLRLQGGSGQADVTGAEITLGGSPNDVYDMLSGNIFLTNYAGIDYIEFSLTSGLAGTIDFLVTDTAGGFWNFSEAIGSGDTHYAFDTTGTTAIKNLSWSADSPPGGVTLIKQVRLNVADGNGGGGLPGVPEPATWAMMLVGFGAIGAAMRRRPQTAMRFNFA